MTSKDFSSQKKFLILEPNIKSPFFKPHYVIWADPTEGLNFCIKEIYEHLISGHNITIERNWYASQGQIYLRDELGPL